MNSEYSLFENIIINNSASDDNVENPNTVSLIDGNEPARLVLYRSTVQDTLRKITSSITIEELMEMFKEIPSFSGKHSIINNLYNILTKAIHDKVNGQVEEHIKEEKLHQKFTILEELINANATNRDSAVWRPTHNVESNLRTYIMKEKLKCKEHLMNLVNKKEDFVNKLKFDITVDRNRILAIEERIEASERRLALLNENMEKLE